MAGICPRLPAAQRPIVPWPADHGITRQSNDGASSGHQPRAQVHSVQKWLSLYGIIKQLYVDEHRKLSEVMIILDRHYGFKAR